MKHYLPIIALLFYTSTAIAQSKNHKFGFTAGGSIQHYNGNLGNSFFQFKTTCFAGVTTNFSVYLNKSFDMSFDNSIGRFGYCPTEEDMLRAVAFELRCPGEACADFVGMGNLRSQIISSSFSIKYKFNNGYFLPEDTKIAPYVYGGFGVNQLSDVMQRDCVNPGTHFSLNGGTGVRYNITERFNVGYNLDIARFTNKKVYLTNTIADKADSHDEDPEVHEMEKRDDYCLRNSISFGINF